MAGRPNNKWLETMIKKHGSREAVTEAMRELGKKGGRVSKGGGFKDPELAKAAGAKGGSISKRGPSLVK